MMQWFWDGECSPLLGDHVKGMGQQLVKQPALCCKFALCCCYPGALARDWISGHGAGG